MNGLTLLLWIAGLTVLFICWRIAVAMDQEITPVDVYCARVDAELDDTDAFYADLHRSVGI